MYTTTNSVRRKLFDEHPYAKRRKVEDDGSNKGHGKFPKKLRVKVSLRLTVSQYVLMSSAF
jgi:hypothetical protein